MKAVGGAEASKLSKKHGHRGCETEGVKARVATRACPIEADITGTYAMALV